MFYSRLENIVTRIHSKGQNDENHFDPKGGERHFIKSVKETLQYVGNSGTELYGPLPMGRQKKSK